jgi:hypothetical protein
MATGAENDAIDEDLGALAAVLRVADPERVRKLMNDRPHLTVRRAVSDDDSLRFASHQPPGPSSESARISTE